MANIDKKEERMSKGLSLAASKDMPKRGFLEVLRDPPSLVTSMEPNSRDGAISTYSGIGAAISVPLFGLGITSSDPIVLSIVVIPMIVFLVTFLVFTFSEHKVNKRVSRALAEAAEASVKGNKDVSISSYLRNEMQHRSDEDYVENLSCNQQLWVEKEWKKEFKKAEEKELASERNAVSSRLDGLLDKERAAEIARHKKALVDLRSKDTKPLNDAEWFEHEMNSNESAKELSA